MLLPERRQWVWIGLPVLLAGLWVVVAHVYYLYVYDVPWPILGRSASRTPLGMLSIFIERLPTFLRIMLLPVVVALGAPEALVVALPYVAHAEPVPWPGFPPHNLQHLAPAMVAVFWGFATTVVRWWPSLAVSARRATWAATVLLVAAAASAAQFSWAAAREYFADGVPWHPEIARLADGLPKDATVLVPHELVARFSHHTRVLRSQTIPTPRKPRTEAEWRHTFAVIAAVADLVVVTRHPLLEEVVAASGRFQPPREASGFRLFVLRDGVPRASHPDRDLQRGLRWDRLTPHQRRWATLRLDE